MTNNLKNKIHIVLAHSYLIYFVLFTLGLFFDFLFPKKIISKSPMILEITGFALLVFASFLILWAQMSSRAFDKSNKEEIKDKKSFCSGPYCYTRHPTHWGIFFLIIGFSFIANYFFVFIFTIGALLITKLFFLKEQDLILEKKYGKVYLDYKKMVKF